MKKLGLVLGAGGSRGIAHIGFLQALDENGVKPDCISGCSMGALVGACYAGGMSLERMRDEINKLKMSNILDIPLFTLRKGGIFRSNKFRNKVKSVLPCKTFEELKIPFSCVATDVLSGETVTFKSGSLAEGVIASCTIPSIFRPLEYEGKLLVDGGVKCRMPLNQIRDLGAEVVVALDVLGTEEKRGKKMGLLNVVLRTVDIVDCEITRFNRLHEKVDLYLEPTMEGMSQYRLKGYEKAFKAGYDTGIENIEKIKKLISSKVKIKKP